MLHLHVKTSPSHNVRWCHEKVSRYLAATDRCDFSKIVGCEDLMGLVELTYGCDQAHSPRLSVKSHKCSLTLGLFTSLQEAMVETNPYLLGLTVAISILHSIFEFLAFKNG